MNGIEKTLRDTLAKLENPDAKTRQKLYDTTESILRRSLEPFVQSRPEMVAERLQDLKDITVVIEQEYNLEVPIEEASFAIPNIAPPAAERPRLEPPIQPVPSVNEPEFPRAHPDPVMSETPVRWPDANVRSSAQEQAVPDIFVEKEPRVAPEPNAGVENVRSTSNAPGVSDELKNKPVVDAKPVSDKKTDPKLQGREKREKRRRRGSLLEMIAGSIVSVVFIVFLFGGIWLFSNSEYYQLFLDWRSDGQTINPEEQVADKDFIPKPLTNEGEQSDTWVEMFGYQDVDRVRGRGEVLVETIDDGGDGGVRITSVNSSEFGEAEVLLDANKLQPLTSRKFVIALSMSVEEPTQIYIRSLLKDGVQADRRRFELNGGINNIMLKMDMTGVTSFDQSPRIAVNSDITGGGRSVELYDVRYQIIE